MSILTRYTIPLTVLLLLIGILVLGNGAAAKIETTKKDDPPSFDFATPVFGLAAAPDESLLVADAGAGVVELRHREGNLIAELPAVTDVAPLGRGDMFATTSGNDKKLYRVSRGGVKEIADLGAFEADVNPDNGAIDSNPFDVAALSGGKALVADAAANALLIVDERGNVDWVATLPNELVSTANIKQLVGCPNPPPDFADICNLPPMIPAQPVTTSVAIGPDGAYYVGELKGFPAPTGRSKIWRIEPGTRHAQCGTSQACTVVGTGFTSIVDLAFGPDGSLYVVELDEASWAAVEFQLPTLGGTVNKCNLSNATCTEIATGLSMPIAVALTRTGSLFAAVSVLIPGAAEVIELQ